MKKFSNLMFYISLGLMTYEKLGTYLLGSIFYDKPISMFILLVYLIINIKEIFIIKYSVIEKIIFFMIYLIIFIGGVQALITSEINYLIFYLNGMIFIIMNYLAFRIYFYNLTTKSFYYFMKTIFYSTLIISLVSGFLEIIYVYILKLPIIYSILNNILVSTRYIDVGRIHFATSEPSHVSLFVLVPLIVSGRYLYKESFNKKYYVWTYIILFLSIFSLSTRTYIDLLVLIFLLFLYNEKKEHIKKIFTIFVIGIFICFLGYLFIYKNVLEINNYHFNRIQSLVSFQQNSLENDSSLGVRGFLLDTAISGLTDKPLLGWGPGRYIEAFKKNYYDNRYQINDYYSLIELSGINNSQHAYSHSFYFTTICECGFLGIIFVLCIIIGFLKGSYEKKSFMYLGLFCIYYLIQSELPGNLPIIMWFAFFQTKKYKHKEMEENLWNAM